MLVDLVTGRSKREQVSSSSAAASSRTTLRRTGSESACRTDSSLISSREGWASVRAPAAGSVALAGVTVAPHRRFVRGSP